MIICLGVFKGLCYTVKEGLSFKAGRGVISSPSFLHLRFIIFKRGK